MPSSFDLTVQETGERALVRAAGELDISTAPKLRTCLSELADRGAAVTLDMTEVEFMDSSGLHALILAAEALGTDGRRFTIVPSEAVLKVLRLVDLEARLPLADPDAQSAGPDPESAGSGSPSGK